jgi:predicted regulator of Ras-like GTPase activity (Roadblock/LC7/MglB family)
MHKSDASIRGGALSGSDGLAVEEWQVSPQGYDLPALCAEMAQFYRESSRIAEENGLGNSAEVFVACDQGMVFVRRVTKDYLLLLVADPDAVAGKCRFHLRQGARRAKEML